MSIEKSLLSFQETTRNSPEPPGMSAWVIEQTIPGSVLSASTVVRKPIWRAAFHSAALVPPNSSRSRMLMIRAACDLVDVPERLTFDFRNIGPAPPPMQRGVVDIVDGDAVVDERVILVREVGGEVVERRLERASWRLRKTMLPSVNASTDEDVLADADLELAERERVIAQAVHQNFLEPVAEGLLLLQRAAELELRLAAGADQSRSPVVADRGGVDARPAHRRTSPRASNCAVVASAPNRRPRARSSMLTAIQTGFTSGGPYTRTPGWSTPTRSCPARRGDHRVVAGLRELQALGSDRADHDERRARREVVLVRRAAGVHLAEVAARLVAGLVEREEVGRAGRIVAQAPAGGRSCWSG